MNTGLESLNKQDEINKIKLNQDEQKEAYGKTRESIMSSGKNMLGFGALAYLGGRGLGAWSKKNGGKILKEQFRIGKEFKKLDKTLPDWDVDMEAWGKAYEKTRGARDALNEEGKKNALRLGHNKLMAAATGNLKAAGKGTFLGTGALMGIQSTAQHFDPDNQGILSDKVLAGDYNKALVAGGVGLTGLGWGAKRHLQKRMTSAVMKKSPEEMLMKEIGHQRARQKIQEKYGRRLSREEFNEYKAEMNALNKKRDVSPEAVLTPEALRLKEIKEKIKKLPIGSVKEQMKLEDEALAISKKMNDTAQIGKGTLRNQARFEGLQNAGMQGVGGAMYLNSPLSPLKGHEDELKEKRYNQERGLSKLSFDPVSMAGAMGAGHVLQNGIFNYFTKTKKGREKSSQFAIDRFTEGYTGKATKGGINDKVTRTLAKYNPLNKFKSKKEIVRDARKKGTKAAAYVNGVGYNLMPEAETIAKEFRHKGAALRQEGIRLDDLSKSDWGAMKRISDGDLHGGLTELTTSPAALKVAKRLFPNISDQVFNSVGAGANRASISAAKDKTGLKAKEIAQMNKEWQETNIQPLMKAVGENISKTKKLPTVAPNTSVVDKAKAEKNAYNISHVGLAVEEPGAAFLNGLKRAATMDKMHINPGDNKWINKAKGIANGTNVVLDTVTRKVPEMIGRAKGLAGLEFKDTKWTKLNEHLGSPALKANAEDAQRIARLAHPMLKDNATKVGASAMENDAIKKASEKVAEAAKKAKEKVDSYGDGWGERLINMSKDGLETAKRVDKDGDVKQGAMDALRSLSRNKETREKGKKGLRELGKKIDNKVEDFAEKNSDKISEGIDKGLEETADLENKYQRWVLPGTAVGLTGLASPMLKDIHDRRQEEKLKKQDTASALLGKRKVAAMAA